MLDVKVWKNEEDNTVMHMFYEKEIASQQVMNAQAALPIKNKISTLSQEVVRRMVNTGRDIDTKIRIDILNKFMIKLRNSGYKENE